MARVCRDLLAGGKQHFEAIGAEEARPLFKTPMTLGVLGMDAKRQAGGDGIQANRLEIGRPSREGTALPWQGAA